MSMYNMNLKWVLQFLRTIDSGMRTMNIFCKSNW